jgi:hypothetical protein
MDSIHKSEVAKIREQIALAYQAASRVFEDFTPTAQHAFITKCQEHIGVCFEELTQRMSPQEAIAIIAQVEEDIQSSFSSSGNTS